jgi:hypothetical protein
MWGVKQLWLIGLVVATITLGGSGPPVDAKPSAPVTVQLEARPVSNGYEITLVAIAQRGVGRLELALAGETQVFGATAAGQRRTLTVTVPAPDPAGSDVVGVARVGGRSKAAVLRLGARRAAPQRPVVRRLPDGREVGEVR